MDFLTFMRNQWDRVAAWVLIALGGLLLLIGWLGVSDALLPTEQMPYIVSGGLGGICLIGIGVMLWLSADLRDEWRKLDRLERRLAAQEAAKPTGTQGVFPRSGRGQPMAVTSDRARV